MDNPWGLPPSPPIDAPSFDDVREAIEAVREAQQDEPQLGSIRGRKVAVWDLLFDMGARREPDGSPAVLRHMGPDVIYVESMPRNVVQFHDTDGNRIRTMIQARDARWYEIDGRLFSFNRE